MRVNIVGLIIFWLVIAELFVVLNLYLYRIYVSWRQERTARATKAEQQQQQGNADAHPL